MWFFKKKKYPDVIAKDREYLNEIKNLINIVISNSTKLDERINKIKDNLRFVSPSGDTKLCDYDKKLINRLDDLRLSISKNEELNIKNLVDEIVTLYIYRTGQAI